MIYGAAYYPEHREKEYIEYDLKMMNEAKINSLRIGEFAWKRFEPEEGQYDFEWLDEFIELASKYDIKILLCPPLRTVPAWMVEKDRSILIETEASQVQEYGSRYTFCINNQYLISKGMELASKIAERYGENDNIIGFHLDNEYGDEFDCHCPICKAKWHSWLINKYSDDIDDLNKRWGNVFWGLEFDSFKQIPTPKQSKTFFNPALLQNWREFRSDCTIEVVRLHADTVRKYAKQPITTNNQTLWNYRTDYYKMANELDVCGINYYPPYEQNVFDSFGLATARSYKQQNFYIYELRNNAHMIPGRVCNMPRPGEVERMTMHSFANGADGVYYFRWRSCPFGAEQNHGTIVSYNGEPTRIYKECQSMGEKLTDVAPLLKGTTIKSDVGVLYDFPTRWMEETDNNWMAPSDFYVSNVKKIYNTIRKLGVNCDAVGRESDFNKYKVLIVPTISAMTDELADKICEYVLNGGRLVWHPLSGYKNDEAMIYNGRLHEKLLELFDIDIIDYATISKDESIKFKWNNKEYEATMFIDCAKCYINSKEGEYCEDWLKQVPVVVDIEAGRGQVAYITTFPKEEFYYDYLKKLFLNMDIRPIIEVDDNSRVEIVERTRGHEKFIFIINHDYKEHTIVLKSGMYDIWSNEGLEAGWINVRPNGVRILVSK